jgi:hypothetical protein
VTFDRTEYEVNRIRSNQQSERAQQRMLVDASQAEPPMESLTSDSSWNIYVQILQAKIEKAEMQLSALQKEMLDQPTMGYESIVLSKTQQLLVQQSIITFKECRDLPKLLLEQGRDARRILKEHGVAA